MEINNLFGSICLTDIPKELIKVGSNGKKYLQVIVAARRETSQYGQTHYIKAYCKKELQRQGVNYYIGELKPSNVQHQAEATTQASPNVQSDQHGDLPF